MKRFLRQDRGLSSSRVEGFTLIELLVVIAIIGILATLILVALNAARLRARDARITANIAGIATSYEVCGDINNGDYTTCDAAGTDVARLVTDILNQGGLGVTVDSATRWCASSFLRSDNTRFVCRDIDGDAVSNVSSGCTSAAQCPSS